MSKQMDCKVIRDNLKSVGVVREGTMVTMVGIRVDGIQGGLGQSGSDKRSSDVGGVRQDGGVSRVDGNVGLSVLVQINAPVVQIVDELLMGQKNGLALGASGLDFSSSGDRSGPWVSQAVGSGAKSVWVSAIRPGVTVGGVDGDIGLSVLVQVNAPVVQVVDELLGGINSDLTLGAVWSSSLSLGVFNLGGSDFRGILDGNGEIVGEDAESTSSIGGVADAHLLAGRVAVSIRADAVTKSILEVIGSLSGVSVAIRSLAENILGLVTASVESGVAVVAAVVAAVWEPLGRGASQEERKDLRKQK